MSELFCPFTRRALMAGFGSAAGAAVFSRSVLAAAPSSLADGFVAAYNSGQGDAVEVWLVSVLSDAGKRRRDAAAWRSTLLAARALTGPLALVSSEDRGNALRLVLRIAAGGRLQALDIRRDRDAPERIFDFRTVDEPAAYVPGAAVAVAPAALADRLRQRVDFAASRNDFSGVVQVTAPDGQAVLSMAHGLADVQNGTALTTASPLNLGSSDKMFTAVIAGQLIDEGRLALDMPVADIPGVAAAGLPLAGVTIGHLLTHQGGLAEPRGGIRAYAHAPYAAVGELLGRIETTRAFEPGSKSSYSNEGYVLIGAAIEAVTGETYWANLERRVYGPAGMTASGHFLRGGMVAGWARGYMFEPDDFLHGRGRVDNTSTLPWRGNACGGGYASAGDMTRFLRALRSGSLLSDTLLRRFAAPTVHPYPGLDYGFGFQIDTIRGVRCLGHSGGGPASGIGCYSRIFVDTGWTVVLLGNYDLPYGQALGQDLAAIVAGHI